jgi:hypothetical protein
VVAVSFLGNIEAVILFTAQRPVGLCQRVSANRTAQNSMIHGSASFLFYQLYFITFSLPCKPP